MDVSSTNSIYSIVGNQGLMHTAANNHISHQQQQHIHQQSIQQINVTNSSDISNVSIIEQLKQSLRQEQNRCLELEKEVNNLKQTLIKVQDQLDEYRNIQNKFEDTRRIQLTSVKRRLMAALKTSFNENEETDRSKICKLEYMHECDECTFRTKSDVSLILHKMNHNIIDQQYHLSPLSFTTRNSNTKAIYQCSACDSGNLTRHQVYRHIYDHHTLEKPLSCDYCELTFTHQDYLDHHLPLRHEKMMNLKASKQQVQITNKNRNSKSPKSPLIKSPSTPTEKTNPPTTEEDASKTPSKGRSSARHVPNISTKHIKCSFPDCNFTTCFTDKLDFHMKAHLNTKFKCPYCPYVSNTITDIKRHIQKSKKHEGMKMYMCQKCDFAADCDRSFKEHLRSFHFGFDASDNVLEYFIEEMFSNKNNKKNRDNIALVTLLNSANKRMDETLIQMNSNDSEYIKSAQPPKKIAKRQNVGPRASGHVNTGQQNLNQNENDSSEVHYRLGRVNQSQQALNQITSITDVGNTLNMYHGLELATTSGMPSNNSFTTVSSNGNQTANMTSIPMPTVPISHPVQSHHVQHHVHQTPNSSTNEAATLIPMPEGFVQALNQVGLVASVQQQQPQQAGLANNTSMQTSNQTDDFSQSDANGIPVSLTQYVSYANY